MLKNTPDKFNRLRQLLSLGATSDECLFYECNDNIINIGGTKMQTFKMPIDVKYIKKLALVYSQDGHIIIKKVLKDFSIAEFDDSLIYFNFTEEETSRFKQGKVEAQLKVLLSDQSILISNILKINAIEPLDNSYLNYDSGVLKSLQCNVNGQKIKLTQFIDIAASSNKTHFCKFIFDSSWDQLEKTAIFKDEHNNYIDDVEIDEDNFCVIPSEVIAAPGNIYIGVLGKKSDSIRPTEWSNSIRVLNSCLYNGGITYKETKHSDIDIDIPDADDTTAGIMKLYDIGGQNVDGSVTQRAITEGFNSIQFSTDWKDDTCLVLNVDFEQEN